MIIPGFFQRVVGLKAKNPKLKVLLAIGGWSFGTAKFKKMAETRFSRQTFIFSGTFRSQLTYIRVIISVVTADLTLDFFPSFSYSLPEKVQLRRP